MTWSLRRRLILAVALVGGLLAVLGGVGLAVLFDMGGRIDAILRENYVSVRAMTGLTEAVDRLDTSFQVAVFGHRPDDRARFEADWAEFESHFAVEERNVTILPAEQELVDRLRGLKDRYRALAERFLDRPGDRVQVYSGNGLQGHHREIRAVAKEILELNQANMEQARDDARHTARRALVGLGGSILLLGTLLTAVTWYLLRTVLGPIRAATAAARAVGAGHLDQALAVSGPAEFADLTAAFNAMSRQLREYRQSNLARLMRAQQTAQATVDSFPDPILVVDPAGRVELANPAARALLGVAAGTPWAPAEPLREPVRDALAAQRPHLTDAFDQAVSFHVDGEERAYLPQVRPVRDPAGDTLGAAVVLNDVTRFRLLDQFKTDLVATVSHELKTPLTSVRLAVHVLLEETVGPLTPKQTELLIDARENAERLLKLIEHLLALARLQRPEVGAAPGPQDPAELLRRAADAVRPRAEDKHVDVVVTDAGPVPPVAVDPDRLALALGNLVDNAVTYTPAGGTVTLSAAAADGRVTLSVADTGVGIPTEHVARVFDKFFRIPGQSAEGGTGLGLAIVKEIVEAHDGEVTCESTQGTGTIFKITLPASTPLAAVRGGTP
jgi:two-component system, NtrC family, sensor histidine kinase KinB